MLYGRITKVGYRGTLKHVLREGPRGLVTLCGTFAWLPTQKSGGELQASDLPAPREFTLGAVTCGKCRDKADAYYQSFMKHLPSGSAETLRINIGC